MDSPCFDQFNESDSTENAVMSVDDYLPCSEIVSYNSDREVHTQNICYYEVGPERVLVILTHPEKLYFSGSLYVECISGVVNIHGYSLRYGDGRFLVLSGYGQSSMCLSAETSICDLLLYKTNDPPMNYVLNLEKFQCFQVPRNNHFSYFEKLEKKLDCMFDLSTGNRIPLKMKYDPSLRTLAADCFNLQGPKVMICGVKGVGKSTSLQYLANAMFRKWSAVVVIDFEIGQPEFSFPGCMSVVLVQKPILSPYFNNIYQPLRSIVVGHVNLDKCYMTYYNAVEELHWYCSLNEDILHLPWLINTMGYIKGFDSLLVISRINFLFNPTHVLKINSAKEPNLNVLPLTPGNLHKMIEFSIEARSFPCFENNLRVPDHYSLVSIPALVLNNAVFIPPRTSREIRVISYMILNEIPSGTCVIWGTLGHKSQKERQCFKKNKVIAICIPYCRSSFMQCVGFGIVLARYGDKIYFQTPLQEDIFINPLGFDIFALELGLRNSSWDRIHLSYQNKKEFEEMFASPKN